MIVATLGSKICDDAIAYSGKRISNRNRIVELSPFTYEVSHQEAYDNAESKLELVCVNEYEKRMLEIDCRKNALNKVTADGYDYLVIDLLGMRMPVREFLLEDGSKYRVTVTAASNSNLNSIREHIFVSRGIGIAKEYVENPMIWSDSELESEIKKYAEYLLKNVKAEKIILLKAHNIYQYISKNEQIQFLDQISVVNKQNDFYDKCTEMFQKYIECDVIEVPENVVGDERIKVAHMFNFSATYYRYICNCLYAIETGNYSAVQKNELLEQAGGMLKVELDEVLLKPLVDITKNRKNQRKIVLIGESEVYEYLLKKRYGINVDIKIPYTFDSTEDELKKALLKIKDKYNEYMCIVPFIHGSTKILRLLWLCGYGVNVGYYCTPHNPIVLNDFVGIYKDCYNNVIECTTPMTFEIKGNGSRVRIAKGEAQGRNIFVLLNEITLEVKEGIQIEEGGFTSTLYDGASLMINRGVIFEKEVHIRGSFFSDTVIGENCCLGRKSILFNGDGHAIIDVHSGNNINYNLENSKPEKHRIELGEAVVVGSNCFILAGSYIGDNCFVRESSLVNKCFLKAKVLAGSPAKEI